MSIVNDFMLLLGVAQKPEPKHHLEDKKRKGWYEVCTTRTVCANGKRNVSAELALYLVAKDKEYRESMFGHARQAGMWVVGTEQRLKFVNPEEAEQMAERLSKMIPVLQEVAARMRAES
jgi:hypothetical protein